MAHDLCAYPDNPFPAVRVLLARSAGAAVPDAEVIRACWHLAGSGLEVYAPHAPVVGEAPASSETVEDILADMTPSLRMIEDAPAGVGYAAVGGVSWALLALSAGRLLVRLLAQRRR